MNYLLTLPSRELIWKWFTEVKMQHTSFYQWWTDQCHQQRLTTPPPDCDGCVTAQSCWLSTLATDKWQGFVFAWFDAAHPCPCFNRCVADRVFPNDLVSGCSLGQRSQLFKGFFHTKCVWSVAREGGTERCRCGAEGNTARSLHSEHTAHVEQCTVCARMCVWGMERQRERC